MDCLKPIRLSSGSIVPCGKCPSCLANRRSEWVFRLKAEYQSCQYALFVTLTYDNDHLSTNDVKVEDVQKFLKRLRKCLGNRSFRYFVTAEYGDHTMRPHYHGLFFFNIDFDSSIYDKIVLAWKNGNVQFGDVEEGSIVYCTKYCMKLTQTPEGCNPTFQLMSRNPGIGLLTYAFQHQDYNQSNGIYHRAVLGDSSSRMPRYFKEKFKLNFTHDEIVKQNLVQSERRIQERQISFTKFIKGKDFDSYEHALGAYNDYIANLNKLQNELAVKHIKKQTI